MNKSLIIGYNGFMHKVVNVWSVLSSSKYHVKDCHELVMEMEGIQLFYLLTNDTRNNILI